MKNTSKSVGNPTAMKRKIKKGKSTQKLKTKRLVINSLEVKICLTAEEYERGLPYFERHKYLSKFVHDSYKEKINRAEANDKNFARARLKNDIALLELIIREMHQQGKLDFINYATRGGE